MSDWFLHHVNMPAHDVRQTARFLGEVIGLKEGIWIYPDRQGELHHDEQSIAYFGTGNQGIHVVRPITTFTRDNGFLHNPTIGGHFALGVEDVAAVKSRLENEGVAVTDAGIYAMSGVHQIYCYDPSFNVIEINEMRAPLPAGQLEKQDKSADVALHTVSIPAHDLAASVAFFRDLIGLGDGNIVSNAGSSCAEFSGADACLRLTQPSATFAGDNDLLHNPTTTPCFSITVADLAAVRERMASQDIEFSDLTPGELLVFCPSLRLIAVRDAA